MMNENAKAAAVQLTLAARLIETALSKLNAVTAECPCCERVLWESHDEGRLLEQFGETPTKLRRAAAQLDELAAMARMPTHGYKEAAEARQRRLAAQEKA